MVIGEDDRLQIEPESYVKSFHELFKTIAETRRLKNDWKKCTIKTKLNKKKDKKKHDRNTDLNSPTGPTEVELLNNASAFGVFSSVRNVVLAKNGRIVNEAFKTSNCNSSQQLAAVAAELSCCDTIESDSDDEDRISSIHQSLPKIVAIGLRSVFMLMKESRNIEPIFCTKGLGALLDILQGQLPEGLRSEPGDVIDPLFDLLLDLATSHGPESTRVANNGTHLTAVACACLLSLVVVRGDTGRLLTAIAAILMSPKALATQNIQLPCVLTSLQRSVEAVLLGKITRPDWITCGVPKSSKLYTFKLKLTGGVGSGDSGVCTDGINNIVLNGKSFVSDGKYLYLHTNRGLLKIGSGYGGTIGGHLYAYKPDFYPTEIGWLGYANNSLYFKRCPRKQCELLELDVDTLTVQGIAVLEGRDWPSSVMFSDGEHLGMITAAGVCGGDGGGGSSKDEGFVVRTINTLSNPVTVTSELPLKLARKCVDVFGWASFDEEQSVHLLAPSCDDEIVMVTAGKEFCLMKTTSGKILYTGKGNCLGMKNNTRPNRWLDFSFGKSTSSSSSSSLRVAHIAAGHDGQHAVLIMEDGSVLFCGTARRGEDGDNTKVRRTLLKPVKPKKMLKAEGYFIVDAACNNGSTALVTKEGSLLMFGKDTLHSDPTTGLVTDLNEIIVQKVALGKAHAAVLTDKGELWTFGINNKGQCGRDFTIVKTSSSNSTTNHTTRDITVVAMETGACEDELILPFSEDGATEQQQQQAEDWEESRGMCPPGQHQWRHRACMVCTVCRECTGFGISCLSSILPNRNPKRPGQECGCGVGDSGCAECGCCRICAKENCDNGGGGGGGGGDMAVFGPSGAGDIGMMRLHMLFEGRSGSNLKDYLKRRLEERKQRQRMKAGGPISSSSSSSNSSTVKWCMKMKGSNIIQRSVGGPNLAAAAAAATTTGNKVDIGKERPSSSNVVIADDIIGGSDIERGDTARIASIPPARVSLPSDSPVVQVACGLHHTVVLLQNGEVWSFGSNVYGQLGIGDLVPHAGAVQVKVPATTTCIQVAAGSNHTVVLTSKGEVYTFGAYQKGQLGTNWWTNGHPSGEGNNTISSSLRRSQQQQQQQPWHSFPNIVSNIGPRWGRRATWIGAAGDQTYIKIDEINSINLTKSTVLANKSCIILIPNQSEHMNTFKCLVINKRDGSCNNFSGSDQVEFSQCIAACLDSLHNVIWTFNPTNYELTAHNVISTEARCISSSSLHTSILSPGLALPIIPMCSVTRTQAAIHLLACLDTLTQAQIEKFIVDEKHENNQLNNQDHHKVYTREDYATVSRFENHGGGWGYSGHSIEAIRFMADTDILIGGYGLFGGRGEYTAKIKLFDIGIEGGDQENDGELLAETEEIPYECEPRQKYSILFDEPVQLQANRWYVAWARVSGPSSDCGSGGQAMVTAAEDQVMFYFKSSKKSNNGTDVNAGQIPLLLYRIITPENHSPNLRPRDQIEPPVYIVRREFSRQVTKDCFQALTSLLQWSWNTLKSTTLFDMVHHEITATTSSCCYHSVLEMDHLVYISMASLRLLRIYVNEIYPNHPSKKTPPESVRLAESIGEVRALLRQILSDSIPGGAGGKTKKKTHDKTGSKMIELILEECHKTFVSCYHAFYPTAYLKWTSLCELLSEINKDQGTTNKDRLLSAVLASLCNSIVRLRYTFPILNNIMDSSSDGIKRQLSPSDNAGLPMMNRSGSSSSNEAHHYPILVEQMSYKSQIESAGREIFNWSFREVLDRLLDLILVPIKKLVFREKCNSLSNLILHCCYLLARVIAELAAQSSGNEDELQAACGRFMYTTPSRFTRTNQTRTWNTGNGSPDAICFSVDKSGIVIAGVCIYGGVGLYNYELELLDDLNNSDNAAAATEPNSHTQRWSSLDFTRGSFGPDDSINDIVELKFSKPVPIKENVKYAIRLRNHGGRTSNGDGGLSVVRGPDGTNFSFSVCSLSFNGTSQTRGQIPHILYYANSQNSHSSPQTSKAIAEIQARKCTLAIITTIFHRINEIFSLARDRADDFTTIEIISNATFVTTLLPLLMAHISSLATSDPKSGVQVLILIQEMLPHVAGLNLLNAMGISQISQDRNEGQGHTSTSPPLTTSNHYTWVESEHPYKPASISHYRVAFPASVKWLTLEFTPECGTCQPEDYLQLYIPQNMNTTTTTPTTTTSTSTKGQEGDHDDNNDGNGNDDDDNNCSMITPVLHKMSNIPSQWPQNAIVLPGNEVIFSLETASDYMKDDLSITYGFKCLVIGYDWISSGNGLKNLETELVFLGGACAASLMNKNLTLPPPTIITANSGEEIDENLKAAQETAKITFSSHSSLLGRGFTLASPPTVSQALDGVLPFSCHSNERLFLRDFVSCSAGTSGGRLARWLQPESFVDPLKCEALYTRENMKCGWPANVTILTRDQYGEIVHVPGLRIEVKAVPSDKKDISDVDQGRKIRRISQPDPMTFGGHPHPVLDVPYEVTVNNKMCFYAITIMKAYQNYSFEELRFTSPAMKRSSESMLVRPNGDGSYSATWTPASVGWYSFIITIDGYSMDNNYQVEVKEPPRGLHPPTRNIVKQAQHQPNRLRKFLSKNSAGLRIRAHPSLQSEQIGIVSINATITFVEEIHNDDGVWLRLNSQTINEYCTSGSGGHTEAWCLGYNQHLGKTLLVQVEEPKSIVDSSRINETILRKRPENHRRTTTDDKRKTITGFGDRLTEGGRRMVVITSGASGHNIRSKPSLKAAPIGMLTLGDSITIQEYRMNGDGTWVRIDNESALKYCFCEGEAWSLAINKHGVAHMKVERDYEIESHESMQLPPSGFDFSTPSGSNQGFNFISQNFTSGNTTITTTTTTTTTTTNEINPFIFGSNDQHRAQSPSASSDSSRFAVEKTQLSPKFMKPHYREKIIKDKERDGGSKFSALQKWLRGDDKERKNSSGRDFSEFVGVSVKELVKAMGESRANGNGATPPETPRKTSRSSSPKNPQGGGGGGSPRLLSRSSSPVPIPGGRNVMGGWDSGESSPLHCGSLRSIGLSPLVTAGMADSMNSQRRGSTQSDTSALVSSLARDPSQPPSCTSSPANTRDLSPSPSSSSLHMRSGGSITASPPDTPRKERGSTQEIRKMSQAQTQTSPADSPATTTTGAIQGGHFSIGVCGIKDERYSSPKANTRRDHSKTGKNRTKRAISPATTTTTTTTTATTTTPTTTNDQSAQSSPNNSRTRPLLNNKEQVKEAMSPSVAECLRAIFGAFLWHEGIVHDAMACASFLKFHPTLPKNGALVVTRQPTIQANDKKDKELSKADRARQRHSVEVTNAGNYLHIQPSTLETLTRSAAGANANRNRKKQDNLLSSSSSIIIKEEIISDKLAALSSECHTVAILPPALKSLVFLWEELSSNCLQAIEQQTILCSPISELLKVPKRNFDKMGKDEKLMKDREKKSNRKKKDWGAGGGGKFSAKFVVDEAASGESGGETTCELCGIMFPHPVTYHMKTMHPGCGWHSGGMGYNNVGNYCSGWAGNCGDSDFGGTCWYLICDACRDNYLKTSKSNNKIGKRLIGNLLRKKSKTIPLSPSMANSSSPSANETHIIMKNNAMFLLDLSSASGINIPKQQRRTSQTLASVAENYSPPEAGSFPPTGSFQCLQALGICNILNNDDDDATTAAAAAATDNTRYYEETLKRPNDQQNMYENSLQNNMTSTTTTTTTAIKSRPLSECPLINDDTADSDSVGGGKNRSIFHRSISMSTGAPWTRNTNDGRIVMMRKRNSSSSGEMNNETGSSLLCYPSAALQKLVPSMDQSAIVSSQNEIPTNDRLEILMRPVMLFIFQQHNLQHLELAMKQALRRTACRVYAMQAFNWLLRSVTQPMCLHDLLWWFVASLTPAREFIVDISHVENKSSTALSSSLSSERGKHDDLDISRVCEHPLSDLIIAGEAANPLRISFHTLLQTIADLMLLLPPGSPLQQAAVRCWGIKFTSSDHVFLHRSHVFSNISKILSRSEEEEEGGEEEEEVTTSIHENSYHQQSFHSQQQITSTVEVLKDVTSSGVEIKASSRQAMIGHLTDNSTETFWESGDEDRNKTKTISVMCSAHTIPRMIYIHIDNCRDLTHKVSSVTFKSGLNLDELTKLRSVEMESRSAGWINCSINNSRHNIIIIELRGPDNSLRVRQIRILGEFEGESLKIYRQLSPTIIQQRNCEAETLKVFRLITSQVFGKLIQGDHWHNQQQQQQQQRQQIETETSNDEVEDSHDLREHMVGILFSRSKLTHLQKQVCTHIVQAIRKETIRIREEWEILLCSLTAAAPVVNSSSSSSSDIPKAYSDTYCFEMLSMVLALSGSSVGRNYLSHQYGLLRDLLCLLHTGSARVQRQVTSLLRRILPDIKPESLANVLNIEKLPPKDFSIVPGSDYCGGNTTRSGFDEHSPGILDVFLSCIAKALTVQVKVKDKENGKALQSITLATSIHPKSFLGSRWWLRGSMTRKLAQVIIQLLKDMASGNLSDMWAAVTKAAIAENILNLTRIDEKMREPSECLQLPTMWLALSSLCVLDSDHVERLSSGRWNTMDGQPPPPRPTCSNHDDGETTAIIQCNLCGNLCADCDRVLHLHRRMRMHLRQVCKEEEEAIRVDLHEGCGRTKLFWILALADSRTLKALVEFRDGTPRKTIGAATRSGVCRFCGTTENTGLLAIGNICSDHECQEHAKNACSKIHALCGHLCGGVRNEKTCLPCLHCCPSDTQLKQDADDMCMICFTEALSCAPAIQLVCGHVFHLHCCRNVLMKRWVGPRITFGFSLCPICKLPMEHPMLIDQLTSIKELYADVQRKALMRLEYEGLHKSDAVTAPGGRYYQNPAAFAMDRYAYYVCYKCQKAYYGGEARCDAQLGGESFDPTELVCGGCSDVARAQMCPKHGADFLEYKCRYCCSTAVFFCFGTTHFCNPCHDDFQRVTNIPKTELPSCPAGPKGKQLEGDECPLHLKHPPTGEEFALGCGICRNAHTF